MSPLGSTELFRKHFKGLRPSSWAPLSWASRSQAEVRLGLSIHQVGWDRVVSAEGFGYHIAPASSGDGPRWRDVHSARGLAHSRCSTGITSSVGTVLRSAKEGALAALGDPLPLSHAAPGPSAERSPKPAMPRGTRMHSSQTRGWTVRWDPGP